MTSAKILFYLKGFIIVLRNHLGWLCWHFSLILLAWRFFKSSLGDLGPMVGTYWSASPLPVLTLLWKVGYLASSQQDALARSSQKPPTVWLAKKLHVTIVIQFPYYNLMSLKTHLHLCYRHVTENIFKDNFYKNLGRVGLWKSEILGS